VFKLRSTPSGSLPTDADLFRTITRGLHGTPMMPATQLKARERWALVFHIEGLSPRFRTEERAAPLAVPAAPKDTKEIRERGQELYQRLRCVSCHGEKGTGEGPAATTYARGSSERQVRIRNFARGRFIRGAELEDIYLTLRTGLDGTPMGAYDGVPDADLWALAAYVRDLVRERPLHELPPAGTTVGQTEP
jgi:mono/diheme cytochrome c family protein